MTQELFWEQAHNLFETTLTAKEFQDELKFTGLRQLGINYNVEGVDFEYQGENSGERFDEFMLEFWADLDNERSINKLP